MPVSSESSRTSFAGNGATTVFATGWKYFATSEVEVFTLEEDATEWEQLEEGSDYEVEEAGDEAGGDVTFDVAPATGVSIRIQRTVALLQPHNLTSLGTFTAEILTEALDAQTMAVQQLARDSATADELDELDERVETLETGIPEEVVSYVTTGIVYGEADVEVHATVPLKTYLDANGWVSLRGRLTVTASLDTDAELCTLPDGPQQEMTFPVLVKGEVAGSRCVAVHIAPSGLVSTSVALAFDSDDLELFLDGIRFYSP
jgi:hypothetical protein